MVWAMSRRTKARLAWSGVVGAQARGGQRRVREAGVEGRGKGAGKQNAGAISVGDVVMRLRRRSLGGSKNLLREWLP